MFITHLLLINPGRQSALLLRLLTICYAAVARIELSSVCLRIYSTFYVFFLHVKQEAQLSQRDRAMLRIIEYFAKSLNVIRNDAPGVGRAYVPISIPL